MHRWWPLVVSLMTAALLAVLATTPPAPRAADAPAGAFSAGRAMADVREISRAPHPTGSADNARVRAWLAGRLADLGLDVRESRHAMSARGAAKLRGWGGSPVAPPVVNLVATLPGGDPAAPAVVVMAHYDSVWGSPAAADDGAGIASALEIVRAVKDAPRRRPLVVVFTDGEELGLEGGRTFVASDPLRDRIGVIVNLETRGGGGRAAMFETGRDNGAMMALFARAVARPSATSLSVFVYELLPNSTDFTPAKRRGLPGFNFAFIGRPALYHSPLARAATLDQGALQDMGAQGLDLVRALLAVPTLPGKAPNLVFFDAFGLTLVRYPVWTGWIVIGAAVAAFAAAARTTRSGWRDVLLGTGALVALVVAAAGLLTIGNIVSGAGAGANYYDRLAAIPRLQLQALLISAGALALVVAIVQRWQQSAIGVAIGLAVPLLAAGLAAQALAPAIAFLLAWPLLLGGAAAALPRLTTPARVTAVALGGGYLLGFAFFLLQGIGPDTPAAAALPLALIAALLWPLIPRLRARHAATAGLVLLVAASGIALWVRFDPLAPTVPAYSLKG